MPDSSEVLVVEDDADLREALCAALEANGFHCVGAANGREALARLTADGWRPAVITLDLVMPELNGWEFVEALEHNERLSSIPVIVASTLNLAPSRPNVRGSIRKPFAAEDLVALIRTTLRSA